MSTPNGGFFTTTTSRTCTSTMNFGGGRVGKIDAPRSTFNTADNQYHWTFNLAPLATETYDPSNDPELNNKPNHPFPILQNKTGNHPLDASFSRTNSTESTQSSRSGVTETHARSSRFTERGNISSLPERPEEVYMRLLLSRGYGKPLWVPEPSDNRPKAYHSNGVHIGDVGFVSPDGVWDCLFNICYPADHAINDNRVPSGFEQVKVHPDDIHRLSMFHGLKTEISTSSIRKEHVDRSQRNLSETNGTNTVEGACFTCTSNKGALLILPQGASRENLQNIELFRREAEKHAKSWYTYARVTRGRNIPNGALCLVTGSDRSKTWDLASFVNGSAQAQAFHSYYSIIDNKTGNIQCSSHSSRWDLTRNVFTRGGPKPSLQRPFEAMDENQCLFLRGFYISLRDMPLHPTTNPSDTSPFRSLSFVGPRSHSFVSGHPLQFVNEALLSARQSAEVAITHDNDWERHLQAIRVTEGPVDLLDEREVRRRLSIQDNACIASDMVFLKAPDEGRRSFREVAKAVVAARRFQHGRNPSLSSTITVPAGDIDEVEANHFEQHSPQSQQPPKHGEAETKTSTTGPNTHLNDCDPPLQAPNAIKRFRQTAMKVIAAGRFRRRT